jgi:hypothetical protein
MPPQVSESGQHSPGTLGASTDLRTLGVHRAEGPNLAGGEEHIEGLFGQL